MEASRLSSISIEGIQKKLQEEGFKLTLQRQATVEILLEHLNELLTAEEIYMYVKQKYPDIGLATIYRTLDLFTELDLVKRLDFGDGRNRYELNSDEFSHFHHHLICVKCGCVKEFEDDMLETLESIIAKKLNFHTTDHQLKVYGFCGDCHEAAKALEAEKGHE